ncbi:hypothetical protein ABBQ32_008319 [Trebouxia sp. C0010 RCD-2024]
MPETCEGGRLETELQGSHEWRNIPPVIQQAFVSLFSRIKSQNHLIKELQSKQNDFVQQQDFAAALASKVSLQEHALKSAKLEDKLAQNAARGDLHSMLSGQAALQRQMHSLTRSIEGRIGNAELQQFAQRQQSQAASLEQQINAKVAAVAAASRQMSSDLAKMQHHQDYAEKSAYTALRDIHKALDGVRSEALDAVSLASTNFAEHTANVQRFQATEQCHVKEQLHSLQQDVAKLKTSNDRLYTQCKGKADREHMQNVIEHLRHTKASVAGLQHVQDNKADLTAVNAALSQVGAKLDSKASVSELEDLHLFRDGGLVGPSGRWQWTSSKLNRNGSVPWGVQCTPLDDQHFVHHKGEVRVRVCTRWWL